MASLLRQQMRKELRRLDATDRDKAIRKALVNRRRSRGAAGWDPVSHPCPWWSAIETHAHADWLTTPVPTPVAWESLDPCRQWAAGQPVLLRTDGHEHVAFIRLEGFCFTPRWLRGSIGERRVSPAELTLRNPREVWSDCWVLSLAQALLSAPHDPRCTWLRDIDEQEEPELAGLLWQAKEELAQRSIPSTGPAPPQPSPAPKPKRAWTRNEIEALRIPAGVIESVNLAADH